MLLVTAFQFTHPGKGATVFGLNKPNTDLFQFTHPGKGATLLTLGVSISPMFQFTHPGKGATLCLAECQRHVHVSIHAPWEGCDGKGKDS